MLGRDVCRVNALSAPDLLSRAVGWCFAITAEAADHRSCLQEFPDKVQCCYLQTERNMDWGHHLLKKVTDFTTSVGFTPVVCRVSGLLPFVRSCRPVRLFRRVAFVLKPSTLGKVSWFSSLQSSAGELPEIRPQPVPFYPFRFIFLLILLLDAV